MNGSSLDACSCGESTGSYYLYIPPSVAGLTPNRSAVYLSRLKKREDMIHLEGQG